MKDSKETEHRISNLKDLLENIQNDEEEKIDIEEDIEEDAELIEYLKKENGLDDDLEIDDEFIYHPGKDDNINAINLEDEEIDENFIIKTNFDENKVLKNNDENTSIEADNDFEIDIGENFDSILNATIGEKPVLAIISLILGIAFIILSILTFNSGTERIVDNVVSGENSFIMVIFLIIGILLLIYGIYKIFNVKSPFDSLASSIKDIEKEPKKEELKKPEPKEQIIPKSNIPLDKESYKIGEFDMKEIRNTLKKPKTKKESSKPKEKVKEVHFENTEEDTTNEKEYKKTHLENESIDEIFAGVEDIDEIPIISVDSKEDKKE